MISSRVLLQFPSHRALCFQPLTRSLFSEDKASSLLNSITAATTPARHRVISGSCSNGLPVPTGSGNERLRPDIHAFAVQGKYAAKHPWPVVQSDHSRA